MHGIFINKMWVGDNTDHRSNGTSPNAVLEVINDHGSTNDALQINRYVSGTGLGFTTVRDVTVSQYGLMGIGVSSPAAHLDISNPQNDNNPLIQATPYGSTNPILHVASTLTDGTPVVSVGGPIIDIPDFSLQVQGTAGISGNLGVWGGVVMSAGGFIGGGDGNNTGWLDLRAESLTGQDYVGRIILSDATLKALEIKKSVTSGYPIDQFVVYGDGHTIVGGGLGSLDIKAQDNTTNYAYANLTEVSNPLIKALAVDLTVSGTTTEPFVVYGDGHTIIGKPSSTPNVYNASTNPGGYSLYVAGGILAEKYKCALSSTSDWSDYVFDKNYKLAPLSDVETYIKTNKHLPGVPSADEVQCDGIDMAKMDATLLKKIEELTLYVLELKKENEAMKAQMNNIKK